jgi:hypothetical protein
VSNDATVFSTDNPEAVTAYLAAVRARREFASLVVASAAQIGKNTGALQQRSPFGGGDSTLGLAADDPADPPVGWVYSKPGERLVPRRGKAGDGARKWLKDHQPPKSADARAALEAHGLPLNDMLGTTGSGSYRFSVPLVFEHEGNLWAMYRGVPGHWCGSGELVLCSWTPRKLSEFYAAKEAFEAAAATAESESGPL